MNLTDYKKDKVGVLDLKTESSSNVGIATLSAIYIKSQPFVIDISLSPLGKYVTYSLESVLPDGANLMITNVIVYGNIDGVKKLVSVSNNTVEKIFIDSKYSDSSMKIQMEYEKDKSIYTVNQEVVLDTTKTVFLDIKEPSITYTDTASLIQALVTRVSRLENRISLLEKK